MRECISFVILVTPAKIYLKNHWRRPVLDGYCYFLQAFRFYQKVLKPKKSGGERDDSYNRR
jgi:hypothetical protein